MNIKDFDYYLPKHLIQTTPKGKRGDSKMMCLKDNNIKDDFIANFAEYLNKNDILVFNQTKVDKARVYGICKSKKIELLIDVQDSSKASCMIKTKCKPAINDIIIIGEFEAKIINKRDLFIDIELLNGKWDELLDKHGVLPLPPYFKREANDEDYDRYQTVFAKNQGSIAAPTASLHFTKEILETISNKGVQIIYIDLEVGFGTFLPVKTENILDHKMHKEKYFISKGSADILNQAKQSNRKIVAIGTTVVRALEHNFKNKFIEGSGYADNFIYPGYEFKAVDAVLTNFHLPKSTLLMLVSAFAGYDNIKTMYLRAVEKEYKFFSYGDCMFLSGTK